MIVVAVVDSCIGSSGHQYSSSYSSSLSDSVVTSFLCPASSTGADIITSASCTTGGAATATASNPMMMICNRIKHSRIIPIITAADHLCTTARCCSLLCSVFVVHTYKLQYILWLFVGLAEFRLGMSASCAGESSTVDCTSFRTFRIAFRARTVRT